MVEITKKILQILESIIFLECYTLSFNQLVECMFIYFTWISSVATTLRELESIKVYILYFVLWPGESEQPSSSNFNFLRSC